MYRSESIWLMTLVFQLPMCLLQQLIKETSRRLQRPSISQSRTQRAETMPPLMSSPLLLHKSATASRQPLSQWLLRVVRHAKPPATTFSSALFQSAINNPDILQSESNTPYSETMLFITTRIQHDIVLATVIVKTITRVSFNKNKTIHDEHR